MRPRSRFRWLAAVAVITAIVLATLGLPAVALAQSMTMSVSPTSGPPGQTITLDGEGFTAYTGSAIEIDISIDHGNGNWDLLVAGAADPVPDANGNFAVNVTIPSNAPPGDLLAISSVTEPEVDAFFTVTGPSGIGTSAPSSTTTPETSSTTTPESCPTVLLGLHGMNEGPSATMAADPNGTVESTFKSFESRAAKSHEFSPNDYQVQDISYPTTGFWTLDNPVKMRTIVSDVVDGSLALEAAVKHYTALCPASQFELVGYSEGAWVVDYWLHFHQSEARSHVKAVQLYGDPNYYEVYRQDRHGIHAYEGLSRLAGLTFGWYGPPYPNPNTPYPVKTVCISKDPVCGKGYTESATEYALQFGAAVVCRKRTHCPHLNYPADGYTKRGGAFLADNAF